MVIYSISLIFHLVNIFLLFQLFIFTIISIKKIVYPQKRKKTDLAKRVRPTRSFFILWFCLSYKSFTFSDFWCSLEWMCIVKSWSCIFIPFFKRFVRLMHTYCIFYGIMYIYAKRGSCRFLVIFHPIFCSWSWQSLLFWKSVNPL